MLLKEIYPFVRQAVIGRLTSDNTRNTYTHLKARDYRIFYIVSGSGEMVISGQSYPLSPCTIILLPSGTEYMWKVSYISYYAINFDYTHNFSHLNKTFHTSLSKGFSDVDILEKICFYDALLLNDTVFIQNGSALENTFKMLVTEFHLGGELCDEVVSHIAKALILQIVRIKNSNFLAISSKNESLIANIIEYITSNYHKNINNEKIALKFNFNPSYLNRIFRQQTGISMHKFLLNYRINTAMEMMSNHNITLEEIASLTGFSSLSHFSKTFKKITGIPPSNQRQ